ncbi:SDR family NAD(P)-dependent oxidoreductase [Tsukamurella asaccharolytica]|uniref:SDR family NAD(P)-dependent oxidoreductase n=1 Tax=Tsukamurella asaccharolytica TaxID=2592067 RepID=A0A5C5RBU1_9ACTN|nr:SDR family NAD(P)-dependent oxidoreductase [Tsukamurella asaccharolytica]TWS19591.1 SDR family NAD(P)-dependent oxidoreductase [Tsukamurella asaccharolytica]
MGLPNPSPATAALVTGASSGIGSELAYELARRGHQVILVARHTDQLELVASTITQRGGRAHIIACDLTDRAERRHLTARVADLGLTVTVLVNNAGMSTLAAVADADLDAELAVVELDVAAVVDLCVTFLSPMVAHGAGAVLNVASTGAFQPLPGQASYGAAKAFVLSYTQSLVGELDGTGVTATVLCPGPVDTGFGEKAGFTKSDAEAALPAVMWKSPEYVAVTAIDALDKGRPVVIPGRANQVARRLGALVPRTLLTRALASQSPALRGRR